MISRVRTLPTGLVVALLILTACSAPSDRPADEQASTDVVGEVHFPVSCDPSLQTDFDNAVATLHSFEYDEARGMFEAIAEADSTCAMPHWGVAMTWYHPLWAPPRAEELQAGSAAIEAAQALEANERERAYIDALAAFYADADQADHRERARRYEAGMAEVHAANPDDREAEIFYALALLSNADPTDKTYAVQKRTGGMLEPLFAEMPTHPGLAHYIIHSYDYPALAAGAEEAAHRYLDIAASMPHALHMSGHIFTQLGMWEESIEANARSAEAARQRGERFGLGQAQLNEMHALDYQVYAHLQRGEIDEARELVDYIGGLDNLNWSNGIVSFNAGAVPVRWAIERRAWDEAAALPPFTEAEQAGAVHWARGAIALRHWARAVGAARSGQIARAKADLAELEALAEELAGGDDLWSRNTSEVLRRQAAGWLAMAEGDGAAALELMKSAAELEDQTDKSGLSPGRVWPAHEQLADLLMELDEPAAALIHYQESLEHASRRFHSYVGAARAAVAAEQPSVAREHYQHLVDLVVADSPRSELAEAREYLGAAS